MKHSLGIFITLIITLTLCMGAGALAETSGLTYTVNEDGVTAAITGYDAAALTAVVEIPETIDGYTVTFIGDNAFKNCDTITSVSLPDTVTALGTYAFSDCDALTTVALPEGLASIGNYAFYSCDALNVSTVPASVETIGTYAFGSCPAITEFTVPGTVTSVSSYAFQNAGLTKLVVEAGETPVTINYGAFHDNTALREVIMPDNVNITGDYPMLRGSSDVTLTVTCHSGAITSRYLWNYNSYNDSAVTSIIIEEGITEISGQAFENLWALTEVQLPSTLTIIGERAFYNCIALESIALPESLTTIGNNAFYSCDVLKDVAIPGNVTSIGSYAFYDCPVLSISTVPASVTSIGTYAFAACPAITEFTVPGTVTSISGYAFQKTGLTKLVVEAGETPVTINSSAFQNNSSLRKVIMPDDVNITGDSPMFNGCSDITLTVTCHSGAITSRYLWNYNSYNDSAVTSIIIEDGITEISGRAFENLWALTEVQLPSTLTTIGESAFSSCIALESIALPESLTTIGNNAFYSCDVLKDVAIPGNVTSIGSYAFYDCPVLSISTVPASVTSIGTYAFAACPAITEFTVPGTVTSISGYAFQKTGLTRLVVEASETPVTIVSSAFYDNPSLREVIMPDDVNITGDSPMFNGCSDITLTVACHSGAITSRYLWNYNSYNDSAVTTIIFEKGITEISGQAFENLWALNRVELPSTLTTIGERAFYGCKKLTSIDIPDGVTAISGTYAFAGTALTSIRLPDSLTSIGNYSFYNCSGLTDVTLSKSLETIGSYAFGGCTSLEQIEFPESLTTINSHAFDSSGLTSVTLVPQDSITLSGNVFEDCDALISVTLGDNVKISSGYSIFTNCLALDLTIACVNGSIPDRYIKTGDYADTAIRTLTIEEGITSIGQKAFYNLDGLNILNLPRSAASIGTNAFAHCDNLTSIMLLTESKVSLGSDVFADSGSPIFYVLQNSLSESYLEENGFTYAYYTEDGASAVYNLPEDIDPAEYAGMKLQLTDRGEKALITCIISEGQRDYVFQGLIPGSMYGLRLTDGYGFVLAEIAATTFAEGENALAFESIPALIDVTAAVTAPDGSDMTEQVTLNWYNASGKRLSQGTSLENIPEGTALTLACGLSDDLVRMYQAPEAVSTTASADTAAVTVALTGHETVTVSGTVTDASDASALLGARVTVIQNYTDDVTGMVSAYTGTDGTFSLDVSNVPGTLVFAMNDYMEQRMDMAEYLADPQAVSLSPIQGLTIAADADLYYAAAEGEEPNVSEDYQERNQIEYNLYNVTRQTAITEFQLNGGEVIITAGADSGDTIRLTAESLSGIFPAVSTEVVVSDQETVTATLKLIGYGRVRLTRESTDNQSDVGMLYNASGRLVREMTIRYGEALAIDLASGEYTLLVMGADNSFAGVNSLESFMALDLTEGVDYLANSLTVADGVVTLCAVDHIPASVKGVQSYVDMDNTVFSSNKTSNALGLYFALKAQTALKEEYAGATDMAWEFTLPDNLTLYKNSLSVNGNLAAHSVSGNTLRVAVDSSEDLVRLCVLSTESGMEPVSAAFTFNHGGKTYRQPVGNLMLEVTDMMFSIPEETSSTTFTVFGTTVVHSTVEIYDNGSLVATTKSKSDGTWRTDVTLSNPGACSGHVFRVKVITQDGKVLTSQPKSLWYSIEMLEVSKVYMQFTNQEPLENSLKNTGLIFDFVRPLGTVLKYNFAHSRSLFTFTVEFTGGDPADASNVKVHVYTDDGNTTVLNASYYESSKLWVASGHFSNGLPANVGVSFDQNKTNMLVYSPEAAQAQLEQTQAAIAEQGAAINFTDEVLLDTASGNTGNFVEAVSFTDGDGMVKTIYLIAGIEPISQETLDAVVADANMPTGYSYLGLGYDYKTPLYYMNIEEVGNDMIMTGIDPENKTRTTFTLSLTNPMSGVATAGFFGSDLSGDAGKVYDMLTDDYDPLDPRNLANEAADNHAKQLLDDVDELLNNSPGISSCLLENMREDYNMIKRQIERAGACGDALGWFERLHKHSSIGAFGDAAMLMGKMLGTGKLQALKDLLEFHNQCPDNFANNNCIPIAPNAIPTIDKNCDEPYDPDPRNPDAKPARDPSGYVYEAVASNRLSGVTATAYQRVTLFDMYDEPYTEDQLWDASEYSQVNPQSTDAEGKYGWDVPEGLWQVRYEKAGYEDAASAWMTVPPIRTEVNVGLVSYVQPAVKKAAIDFDGIDITFTKYMSIETLNTGNITVTAGGQSVSGTIELVDAEVSPENASVYYASKVRFIPDTAFAADSEVTLNVSTKVKSYAGVAMASAYSTTAVPAAQPRALQVSEAIDIVEGNTADITVSVLPAEAGAGRRVSVSTTIGIIEISATELILDENGTGKISVSTVMPGSAPVVFTLEDTELVSECSVSVIQLGNVTQVATPTASLPGGSYVPAGSTMELFCETPEAIIYYTLDDTCPCVSETRIQYAGPITLTESATLRACAEKDGMDQSEVLKVPFTVTEEGAGTINLPAALTSIDDEMFIDCTHIQQVIVPDGVTYIGVRAFQNCISLRKIVIPDSVTWIRNCAFNNCPQVVIWCNSGSYAHNFAIEHDLAYVLTGNAG